MKTKTLLIAAATLAVGAISSQAQVYSQNIVGYVNVPVVTGYNLIANPLDDGTGNQLTNVMASANLANKSSVQTWNVTVYNTAITKGASGWGGNTQLPPGTGFFVKNTGTLTTNTFTGTLPTSGSSVTNVIGVGYNLVSSIVPLAGDLTTDTNLNFSSATLANKSSIQSWNTGGQVFNTAVTKGASGWGSAFNITVGQGFFVKSVNTAPTNWVQIVP